MQKRKLFTIGAIGLAAGLLAVACYLVGIWIGLGDYSWDDDGLDGEYTPDAYSSDFTSLHSAHP